MNDKKAFFVGGGIGSMAGAHFLIRDAGYKPENITIFEALNVAGGSMDGSQLKEKTFVSRGGRMLNAPAYECLWELCKDIPSL